jgi:surface polysaccharide O-acyltransferase-like enzyme
MANKTNPDHQVLDASSGHIEYIDILRIFSMWSVVFLHSAAGLLRSDANSLAWSITNVLTGIMSTSVPIFFMISGALLLRSENTISIRYTFRKRLPKVLIPFLTWSFVAAFYYLVTIKMQQGYFDGAGLLRRLSRILVEPTTIHLWFMYALIPMYMIAPLLKKLVTDMNDGLKQYMVAIWLVFGSVVPTIVSFFPDNLAAYFNISNTYSLNFMGGFLGYFIVGYLLLCYKRESSVRFLAGVVVIDTVIISVGTWWRTTGSGVYDETFKTYPRFFVLILSVSFFLLAKEIFQNRLLSPRASAIIKFLSGLSFGVYLVHNLVIDLLAHTTLMEARPVVILAANFVITIVIAHLVVIVLASSKWTSFIFTGLSYSNACRSCNMRYLGGLRK